MGQSETIAVCVLLLFCSSSIVQGEDESDFQIFTIPSTSSPPQRSSITTPESLTRPIFLTASTERDSRVTADLPANITVSQNNNDTANSTGAPGFPTGATQDTVYTLAPINSTSVPVNLTDSQYEAGDNQTSTTTDISSSTPTTTTATTPLPKVEPKTSTLAPSTRPQILSASTSPQGATSHVVTTRIRSSNFTMKGTSAPPTITKTTTTTTTTAQTTELSSTPVLAKARVDPPEELNVGDDTEHSGTPTDPLLAGLVSVFVVTAAIVALLIFLKFRHRNDRPEFRRLQDLPMDDMMEDTPLSMYSY